MTTWPQHRWKWLGTLLPLSLMVYACGNSSPNLGSTAGESPAAIPCDTNSAGTAAGGTAANGEVCTMPPADGTAPSAADGGMAHGDHTMDLGPADATYDLRFIDAMVIHHQGAVTMAEAALEQSQRPEIRQLAEAIIAAQAEEIGQMQQWRKDWYPDASAEPVMYHAAMKHDMAMAEEMAAAMRMDVDLGMADDEFDLRFLNAMIPHHEGALVMAKDVQAKSTRPEMQTLTEAILTSQQAEIDEMQQWRKDWYGQ